jgi:hypothetical protein
VAKVDKDAPKVAVVFFKPVVERPNVRLIEKAQHSLLGLTIPKYNTSLCSI